MKSERKRIAALEHALVEAHLKLRVHDELITQESKHFKADLKKALVRRRSRLLPGRASLDVDRSRSA